VIIGPERVDRTVVRTVLDALPAWFGRPEATAGYAEAAERLPTYRALDEAGTTVGVLVLERHTPEAAEVHVMAVLPDRHRGGVGRALLARAERDLRASGTVLLQVKTLGPSDPDEGYRLTREFYRAAGFLPLEETADLWPGTPCLILVKPLR
jgi:GNAT superfamily N-acetyltransferase